MRYWISIGLTALVSLELLAAETRVQAIDAASGQAVPAESIVTSPRDASRVFVGTNNTRVELAAGGSGFFDAEGMFQLVRGSAVVDSAAGTTVRTVNAAISLTGKAIFSYDFREESTSAFVVFGQAKLENRANPDSKRTLARHQGATLVTGDFYPTVLRNLDFTKADAWLTRYGWSQAKRAELLHGLPDGADARQLASLTEHNQEKSRVSRELASYFPVASPREEGPRKYESDYTSSAMRGQEHSEVEAKLAKGEEIEIISPEQAAVIVLPEIDLGPGIRLSAQREDAPAKKARKPASLAKVKSFTPSAHPAPAKGKARVATQSAAAPAATGAPAPAGVDPAISSALDRLNQVDAAAASVSTDSEDRRWDDLRQNF